MRRCADRYCRTVQESEVGRIYSMNVLWQSVVFLWIVLNFVFQAIACGVAKSCNIHYQVGCLPLWYNELVCCGDSLSPARALEVCSVDWSRSVDLYRSWLIFSLTAILSINEIICHLPSFHSNVLFLIPVNWRALRYILMLRTSE